MDSWKDDEAVDSAFSRLFSTLPPVTPSPGFVQSAVEAAWKARAARRRWAAWTAAAAAVTVVVGASLVAMTGAPAWTVLTAAQFGTASVMTLVWSATSVAEFWGWMVSAGTVVGHVVLMPQSLAVLLAAELVGAAALYSLHRLLRDDVRFRRSGPLCI